MPPLEMLATLTLNCVIELNAPFGPPKTMREQSGSLMFAVQVARITLVEIWAIALVKLIEYQSAETVRPSTQCGVRTTPPEMVRATSGTRFGLPVIVVKPLTVLPVLGSTKLLFEFTMGV